MLLFVTKVTGAGSANMFGQSLLITQGAPGTQTRTAIMYIAQEGSAAPHGNATAMSFILALFLSVTSR